MIECWLIVNPHILACLVKALSDMLIIILVFMHPFRHFSYDSKTCLKRLEVGGSDLGIGKDL